MLTKKTLFITHKHTMSHQTPINHNWISVIAELAGHYCNKVQQKIRISSDQIWNWKTLMFVKSVLTNVKVVFSTLLPSSGRSLYYLIGFFLIFCLSYLIAYSDIKEHWANFNLALAQFWSISRCIHLATSHGEILSAGGWGCWGILLLTLTSPPLLWFLSVHVANASAKLAAIRESPPTMEIMIRSLEETKYTLSVSASGSLHLFTWLQIFLG